MPTEDDTRIGIDEDCIPPDLQSSVVLVNFLRLGTRLAAVFDEQFAATGLDQALFRALLAVSELETVSTANDGATLSHLADYLLMDEAEAMALIYRLAETGVLEPDTNRLCLTPQGQIMLAEIMPTAITFADNTFAGISQADLSRLLQILAQIEDGLTE